MMALGLAHPLASVSDLSLHLDRSTSSVYRSLWQLASSGLVSSDDIGATKVSVSRWWLTSEGMSYVDPLRAAWHLEGGRARLLERLPLVEWFYPLAHTFTEVLGRMDEFR